MIAWVVVLAHGQGIYGPFADFAEAGDFANFLRIEVDPATVHELKSPVGELLAWRNTTRGLS